MRIPTAIAMPSETMNVIAAHERAIWWAASDTAPSHPIMTVAAAKAPLSKRRPPAAGAPTLSICLMWAPDTGASQCFGHAGRMDGSRRSQAKITTDPSVREMRVETPAPVSPRAGKPRCP